MAISSIVEKAKNGLSTMEFCRVTLNKLINPLERMQLYGNEHDYEVFTDAKECISNVKLMSDAIKYDRHREYMKVQIYTVLLMYPDSDNSVPDTFLAHVEADTPDAALKAARAEAADASRDVFEPEDFACLLLVKGAAADIMPPDANAFLRG